MATQARPPFFSNCRLTGASTQTGYKRFSKCYRGQHQYVCEFRDATWYTAEIYQLLRQHNVALFLHDWRGERSPVELTADFTYVRFHGAAGKYQGNYTPQMLGTWADMIQGWLP
ncbi:MAG TPA: DUF72 domain-containing protein [Terriglobales bacterium]|nr:DUF72 domain-containing protein [Terriglobales bacterium]